MKSLLLALAGILLASASVLGTPVESGGRHLLGAKECSWGPTYWCSNFKNAKSCNAVTHCIQTVWERQKYPVDNDEICNICLDMVKQARDQLESNETQADLKAVFEGSCKLMPIKVVKKECMRLADDFVPELVEALASQMNPNVVCSVAGLCNNAAIDKMLEEMPAIKPKEQDDLSESTEITADSKDLFTCSKCNKIAELISNRFHASDRDQVLEGFLRLCGQMGSFSDGCSNIVLVYFNEIYDHITNEFNAKNICHLSGTCADQYHKHEESSEEIEIRPMGGVGIINVNVDEQMDDVDIPCKLCEQLVDHLRDVLIANTTELEFKQVLEGLCKQTKSFSEECLSLVDQYYEEIYNTLVHNLDSNGACFMIGVCPKNDRNIGGPVMPIVPVKVAAMVEQSNAQKQPPRKLLGENEPKFSAIEIQQAQLPIDRIMGAPLSLQLVKDGSLCTICEYFMHFVQEALSEPNNEDEIKNAVATTCDKLPNAVKGECHNFVNIYGDAIIALLIQSIDPRQVCPELRMCPATNDDIEVFSPAQIDVIIDSNAGKDKPTCPLCLFAVSQLIENIKNDKSKQNIENALSRLCSHLSPKLKTECNDFVETYSSELVDMLVSDFTPVEICVYLKLCVDSHPDLSLLHLEFEHDKRHQLPPHYDIETNEIPDITVNGQITVNHDTSVTSPECLLCEEMVKEVEKRVKNKKSKEEIKTALEHACDRLRKYKTKCTRYIDQHSDQIIDLLMKEMAPKEICHELGFCIAKEIDELEVDEALLDYVVEPAVAEPPKKLLSPSEASRLDTQPPQCALCEFVLVKLESELGDKKTEQEIENAVRTVCSKLPNTVTKQCNHLIDQYGPFIIKLLSTLPPKEVCTRLALCEKQLLELKENSFEIIECSVCHGAVEALDEILDNKQVDLDVLKDVEKVCNTLPAQYFSRCEKIISVYGISMVRQLQLYVEKGMVCVNIGLCSKPTGYVQLDDEVKEIDHAEKKHEYMVGLNECSWGPVHWCSSTEVAEKCNASKYCSEKKIGKWRD